jgi:hypothetical protein
MLHAGLSGKTACLKRQKDECSFIFFSLLTWYKIKGFSFLIIKKVQVVETTRSLSKMRKKFNPYLPNIFLVIRLIFLKITEV